MKRPTPDGRYELAGLGRAIRHLRAEQNISAGELAVAAGLTPGRLYAIEAGRFDPAFDELLALADGLRVTPAALVGRADAETTDADARSSIARTRLPADVVVLLRGALYTELARASEDAPGELPDAHTRSGWADVLARIDGARNALDALGWNAPARQQDVEVELDRAMIDALDADIDFWEWLAEQDRTETPEGRTRAAAKANTIKRFLASVTPPEIVRRADAETKDGDT